jgi:NAD(P)-dependent dehydrogenase (short-subunit alcohol dehydrogenase family)
VDLNKEAAVKVAGSIENEFKTPCIGIAASVLDKSSLEAAKKEINNKFGSIDILVNGGRRKCA